VVRTSISDAIVEQIMGLIETGDLQPGQRLPSERELCVRFGAGRSSLREALRCLSIVGVLDARVGEGTSVAKDGERFLGRILQWRLITEQHDLENLVQVRIGLEGISVAGVAAHSSDEDLQTLDNFIDKMTAVVDDPRRFLVLDHDFHLYMARVCGNSLVYDLLSMMRAQLSKGLTRVLMPPNGTAAALREHKKIVQKIRERDPAGATEAVYSHLQASLVRYRKARKAKDKAKTNKSGDS
jgi:GntR family transcriptional repressor for pyruvate dehydrogenase complex